MSAQRLCIALLLITSITACDNSSNSSAPVANQHAPAASPPGFSLPDLDGKVHSLKQWQGKFIVINFWATWCPPCRTEIPMFIELQNKYADQGMQFIGIAIDDDVSVQHFSMEMGINYPNLIAESQGIELARQYGNLSGALPFSVLINPEGQIIARHIGILPAKKILELSKLAKN